MIFIWYPKCSTCQKAKKWLNEHGIAYTTRHIKEDNPSLEELGKWYSENDIPLKKFFNTSGMLYRDLGLKDRLPLMSDEEKLGLTYQSIHEYIRFGTCGDAETDNKIRAKEAGSMHKRVKAPVIDPFAES